MALFNHHHHFDAALLLLLLLPPHCLTNPTPPPPPAFKKPPSPTPPPPPPPLNNNHRRRHHHQQFRNIIDAIIGAGDFTSWANILSSSGPTALPLSATVFVPADDSLPPPSTTSPGGASVVTMDPLIFPYHIVPQRLSFSDLCEFKLFSRLPTLLASKSILITNNSRSNFTLDDSSISHPDIYSNSAIAIHGITNLLDYSVYGDSADNHTASPPPSPPQLSESRPADDWMSNNEEEVKGSDAACICAEVGKGLVVGFAVGFCLKKFFTLRTKQLYA